MLAIALFYFVDACVPLQRHQGLLLRGGHRTNGDQAWQARLAQQGLELHWAYVQWPHWLLAHRPVYRLSADPAALQWPANLLTIPLPTAPAANVQALQAHANHLRRFTLPLVLLAISLWVLLPITLFVLRAEWAQLTAAALIYICTWWLAVQCWRAHGDGIAKAKARSIALHIMLCPPLALNVVKKLSLAYAPATTPSLPGAALALLAPTDCAALARQWHDEVDEELADLADDHGASLRTNQLRVARQTLTTLAARFPAANH